MAFDKKAFRSLSYGLYIVTAQADGKKAGCVVNTFAQVTSNPPQASVAINKENATTDVILKAGMFGVSALSQDAPMELIGRFGFHSSADIDKYADTQMAVGEAGVSCVTEHAVATFVVKVKETLDMGTHLLIMGEVVESSVLSSDEPMTYAYYHQVKGGKTPPKASSYEGDASSEAAAQEEAPAAVAESKPKVAWRCKICGHIEYVDELPDDFKCPICGVGKELFEKIKL